MFVCVSVSYQNPENPEFARSCLCTSPLNFTRLSEARQKVSEARQRVSEARQNVSKAKQKVRVASQPTAGARI